MLKTTCLSLINNISNHMKSDIEPLSLLWAVLFQIHNSLNTSCRKAWCREKHWPYICIIVSVIICWDTLLYHLGHYGPLCTNRLTWVWWKCNIIILIYFICFRKWKWCCSGLCVYIVQAKLGQASAGDDEVTLMTKTRTWVGSNLQPSDQKSSTLPLDMYDYAGSLSGWINVSWYGKSPLCNLCSFAPHKLSLGLITANYPISIDIVIS